MKLPALAAALLTFSYGALWASPLPDGKTVEVAPLTYHYTVVQHFENSVNESSHTLTDTPANDQNSSNEFNASKFTYFTHTLKDREERSSRYRDTLIVEKTMQSDKMTSVIETALSRAGVPMGKSGEYLLTGSIKAMRTDKPRRIPDGTGTRFSVESTTSLYLQITDKNSGKTVFADTFTGIGKRDFHRSDPIPVDKSVDLSVQDLTAQITKAFGGEKKSKESVDYQDSPGKRLID